MEKAVQDIAYTVLSSGIRSRVAGSLKAERWPRRLGKQLKQMEGAPFYGVQYSMISPCLKVREAPLGGKGKARGELFPLRI